jgi:hypothetical protein
MTSHGPEITNYEFRMTREIPRAKSKSARMVLLIQSLYFTLVSFGSIPPKFFLRLVQQSVQGRSRTRILANSAPDSVAVEFRQNHRQVRNQFCPLVRQQRFDRHLDFLRRAHARNPSSVGEVCKAWPRLKQLMLCHDRSLRDFALDHSLVILHSDLAIASLVTSHDQP